MSVYITARADVKMIYNQKKRPLLNGPLNKTLEPRRNRVIRAIHAILTICVSLIWVNRMNPLTFVRETHMLNAKGAFCVGTAFHDGDKHNYLPSYHIHNYLQVQILF